MKTSQVRVNWEPEAIDRQLKAKRQTVTRIDHDETDHLPT
jgi:hypothetical protein